MKYLDPRKPWLVVLIVSLAIFACSLPALLFSPSAPTPTAIQTPIQPATLQAAPSVSSSSAPGATPQPAITYQPTFEPAPCAFPIPRGYSPECGYLIVPENRTWPDSRLIRLHVAIFRNRAGVPTIDPVIKISGGPGSSGLNTAGYLLGVGMDAVLDQRDFVVFDQRGTGYSKPRLDCPERVSITSAVLGGRLTAEESAQAIVESFRRCRDRLIAEGVDLSVYNSAASAADINDLRIVLGYEKLNLYAISYGTRLALTLIRDYPNTVRSVVLDSTYPLDVNLYTTLAPNAERAFNVFFNHCAADPNCSSSYPDLRNVFYRLVDDLNTHPAFVPLYIDNGKINVRLDGGLLIDILFGGLYSPAVSETMPQMISEVRAGRYNNILSQRLERYFETATALGMQMAVQCAEEIPFSAPEEAFVAAQGVQPQIAAFFPASVQPLFAVCKEWTVTPPDPRENLSVSSDVPTLILAGEGDPITPPEWGRRVAEDLSHAYFYEFPGSGHWVARSSSCAMQMALTFWENPTADPGSADRGSACR
jgi:pimeloyl-ACP methyl ester carboxylesterase